MKPLGHDQTRYLLSLISSKKQELEKQEIKVLEEIERQFEALPSDDHAKQMKEKEVIIAKQRAIFSESLRKLEEMESNFRNFHFSSHI